MIRKGHHKKATRALILKNRKNKLFLGQSDLYSNCSIMLDVNVVSINLVTALKVCLTSERGWRLWGGLKEGSYKETQKAIMTFTLPTRQMRATPFLTSTRL